jgi:hypothetical protein
MIKKKTKKRISKTRIYVLGAVILGAALGAFLYFREEPRVVITPQQRESTPYQDGIGVVATFSSEKRVPFRSYGKTINDSPYLRRFVPSVEKFDNVLSCLSEEARVLEKPSLGDFDWTQIDSDEDAAVCLFRVATSYATMDDMESCMRSQGLRVGRRLTFRGRIGVSAYWPIKEKGPLYRANIFQGWLNWLTAWGQTVTVTYREGQGVFSTGVSVTRE